MLGLVLGSGLLLIWLALTGTRRRPEPRSSEAGVAARLLLLLRHAGAQQITVSALLD